MDKSEQMESRLRRELIPRGMSPSGLESLESMIDELATDSATSAPSPRVRWWAVACVFVAGVTGWWMLDAGMLMEGNKGKVSGEVGVENGSVEHADRGAMRLLSESEGVVAADAEGEMVFDEDGRVLEAWRVQVMNEERFHDEETGHEVRVFSPRDELVLMPVHTF